MSETPACIVLVGLMGAGKTSIGRKLADQLGMPFVDADEEIVAAAGCEINDIFEIYGEAAFRDVEARVIARILSEAPCVLATGGGAFMNAETRDAIAGNAVTVWLRAELDTLVQRTSRRNDRPLLKTGDPREILGRLMDERYPVYAEADITVNTGDESIADTVGRIADALISPAAEVPADD